LRNFNDISIENNDKNRWLINKYKPQTNHHALIYISTGLAIIAGWIIGKLKLEKWVEEWVYTSHLGNSDTEEEKLTLCLRVNGLRSRKKIMGKIWLYFALGIQWMWVRTDKVFFNMYKTNKI